MRLECCPHFTVCLRSKQPHISLTQGRLPSSDLSYLGDHEENLGIRRPHTNSAFNGLFDPQTELHCTLFRIGPFVSSSISLIYSRNPIQCKWTSPLLSKWVGLNWPLPPLKCLRYKTKLYWMNAFACLGFRQINAGCPKSWVVSLRLIIRS